MLQSLNTQQHHQHTQTSSRPLKRRRSDDMESTRHIHIHHPSGQSLAVPLSDQHDMYHIGVSMQPPGGLPTTISRVDVSHHNQLASAPSSALSGPGHMMMSSTHSSHPGLDESDIYLAIRAQNLSSRPMPSAFYSQALIQQQHLSHHQQFSEPLSEAGLTISGESRKSRHDNDNSGADAAALVVNSVDEMLRDIDCSSTDDVDASQQSGHFDIAMI